MQGEKTIVAYFPDKSAAYKTAKSLRADGLGSVKISQLSGDNTDYDPTASENLTNLAGPTYDYANADINIAEGLITATDAESVLNADNERVLTVTDAESVLNAADTEAGDYSGLKAKYTLTLSTTREKAGQAVNLIRKYGGVF